MRFVIAVSASAASPPKCKLPGGPRRGFAGRGLRGPRRAEGDGDGIQVVGQRLRDEQVSRQEGQPRSAAREYLLRGDLKRHAGEEAALPERLRAVRCDGQAGVVGRLRRAPLRRPRARERTRGGADDDAFRGDERTFGRFSENEYAELLAVGGGQVVPRAPKP